jgi:hypothetical protein
MVANKELQNRFAKLQTLYDERAQGSGAASPHRAKSVHS